jgi:hypothetical protein
LVFVDVSENSIMVDDSATPSNPLVTPIKEKKLEKTPNNVNVSQWSHEK